MKDTIWGAVNLAFQLGYMIAIPVVILGFSGAFLDKKLGTSPLFILIGMAMSATFSCIAIYRKVKTLNK